MIACIHWKSFFYDCKFIVYDQDSQAVPFSIIIIFEVFMKCQSLIASSVFFCVRVGQMFNVSCNISLYHDTKVAIYRYTQIVYRSTYNTQIV